MPMNRVRPSADVGDAVQSEQQQLFTLRQPRCSQCGPIGAFLAISMLLLPILIFVVSALFALPFWAVECADDAHLCDFYEW